MMLRSTPIHTYADHHTRRHTLPQCLHNNNHSRHHRPCLHTCRAQNEDTAPCLHDYW